VLDDRFGNQRGRRVAAPVTLPARLDSAAAVQLARTLSDRQGADVVLDAAGVDLLGAKAMQTLLVAAAAWRAAGSDLSVINISPGARAQLADLGLSDTSLFEGAAP
jgi:anti-anti-sigma regulatory factor